MKLPWTNTTGLAKAVAIFATGLVICLGLCGLNVIAELSGVDDSGKILGLTAYLEIAGLIICAVGLVAVLIVGMVKAIYLQLFERSESFQLDLEHSHSDGSQDELSNEATEK